LTGVAVRLLVVTNMYPTPKLPGSGTFVAAQVESLRAAGLDVHVLHLARAELGRSVYRGLGEKVRTLVADFDPAVTHVMYGGVMADGVTRALPADPVVVSFCGSDLLGERAPGVLERLSIRHGVRASRRAAERAAGIVVKSQNLLEALPPGVPRARAWIVPNGIDLARFRPLDPVACRHELGWDPDRRHVLFPAQPSRPEKRYSLAVAGVQRLEEGGTPVELHALEGVEHGHVPVWLNAAHVVVLTSEYEGSPNAVKEALACDVAVVSVDVGDVRERLDGIAGCFLADPTPEDIAEKIRQALAHPVRVRGRKSVSNLALEAVAARLREIYRVVVNGR
jgi:glycosyltransferase involved in cell wall biosynthesis